MSSAPAPSELLYYTYYTERGSGPPLLLVHGLMVTDEMFEPVVGQLATRHRMVVPDLRDHLGIDATAVLGYSQGGAIAQQLVLDHPRRCERLVLACTYAFNMATPREWLEGHLVPLLLHVLGMRGWRSSSSHRPPSSSASNVPPGSPGSSPTRTAS